MPTKRGHDDNNGPATSTCWQNLGEAASGAQLELVAVVHGHEVIVEAPMGTAVLFKAWLPHLTRASAEGPSPAPQDWRLHHTAYWRFGTEYFAWVAGDFHAAGQALSCKDV